jgi:acyl-CoA reductase-like NAD-dependent aldehyde dehydrogenase
VAIGAALASHPDVAKISFTGETATGRAIMTAAAQTIKRIGLELGGKSPNIIFGDVDIQEAASNAVASVFDNAGQDCCARSRIIVECSIADAFVEALTAATKAIVVGDPLDQATHMGPLVSQKQREVVESYVSIGKQEGAKLMCGGERLQGEGYFLRPAVFAEARPRMRIVDEEIFGPVVAVMTFDTEDEAIALANDTIYGLSGSLWTNDLKRGLRVASRKTGTCRSTLRRVSTFRHRSVGTSSPASAVSSACMRWSIIPRRRTFTSKPSRSVTSSPVARNQEASSCGARAAWRGPDLRSD